MNKRCSVVLVMGMLMFFGIGTAQAVPVMLDYRGVITNTHFGPNIYGLEVGDTILLSVTIDDEVTGRHTREFDDYFFFYLTMGSITYSAKDDTDWPTAYGYPFVDISPDFRLLDFNFSTPDHPLGGFVIATGLGITASNTRAPYTEWFVGGHFDGSPVPEPGTFYLLGVGVIGLVVRKIRKNRMTAAWILLYKP